MSAYRDSQRGLIGTAGRTVAQHLHNPYYTLSNKFEAIQPVGRQLVSFSSTVAYNSTPQRLQVSPGQFEELLNKGATYDELEQQVDLSSFYTHQAVSITKGIKQWTFTPQFGFQVQNQKLESELVKVQHQDETAQERLFQNNLDWESRKYYGQLDVRYKAKYWEMTAKLPLGLQSFEFQDKPLNRKHEVNRLITEPHLSLKYDVTPLWRARASVQVANQFGNIEQMNYAYILRDYRHLQLNNSPLQERLLQRYTLGLSYKNALTSFFSNLSYSFSTTESNLIYQNNLQQNGALVVTALDFTSTALSHTIGLQTSKYFSELQTTLAVGTNLYLDEREQILNQGLAKVQNQNLAFHLKTNTSITEWLGVDYTSTISTLKNIVEAGASRRATQQEHHLSANIYPADRHYIGLTTELYHNDFSKQNPSSFFGDLLYRYTFERKKLDMELKWVNISNVSAYTYSYNDAFTFVQSTYRLRPSQLLLSFRFSL
ncbi:hypothetical protein GCM10028895_12900 [Pontibacter rugosus]